LIQKNKPLSTVFFGWWTVLATSLLCAFVQGFYTYGISVIFKPLAAELGFNRTVTSVGASLGRLEGGFQGPITGWLVDRFGPKWVIFFSVLLVGIGLILVNFIHTLWQYYVVWGVLVASGVNVGLTIPVDKIITDWFVKKRGLAMGIKFAFVALGGIVVVPITTWLTASIGWRMACVVWGVLTFISLLLVVFFVKQKRPEYYGLLPDGARVESTGGHTSPNLVEAGKRYASNLEETEFSLKEAMRTAAFWLLMVVGVGYSITGTAIIVHAIPFLTDRGIDATAAGYIMGLMIFVSVPARLFSGIAVDHVKKAHLGYVIALSLASQSIGIAIFLLWPSMATVYVFFIFFGIGSGAPSTLSVLMRSRFFGRKAYGSISGILSLVNAPVALVAPIYAGWVYDTTKSYATAFLVFAILVGLCAVLACFIRPPSAPSLTTNPPKQT
jgi:cyanate permease